MNPIGGFHAATEHLVELSGYAFAFARCVMQCVDGHRHSAKLPGGILFLLSPVFEIAAMNPLAEPP